MTRTCQRCQKRSTDGHLCHECTRAAKAAVGRVAELWPHVEEAITRRDHLEPSGEVRAKMIFGPLPFRPEVQKVADEVRNDLVGWARICIEEYGCDAPADTIGGVCGLLVEQARRLRRHPAANEWAGSMLANLHRISKAIDLADRRLLAGPCPERTQPDNEPCGGMVYAVYPVDERERARAECTKPPMVSSVCGRVWQPEEFDTLGRKLIARQAQIDAQKGRVATDAKVDEFAIDPPEGLAIISVADAATIYGIPQRTIYRWTESGHQLIRYHLVAEITSGRSASVGVDSEQVARLAAQRKAELVKARDRK